MRHMHLWHVTVYDTCFNYPAHTRPLFDESDLDRMK